MLFRPLTLAALGLPLLFGGCVTPKPPQADYAKRAFLQEEDEVSSPSPFPSEDKISKATIHIEPNRREVWEKQSYETLDAWIERLKTALEKNNEALQIEREMFDSLVEEERALSDKIENLVERNNAITATLQDRMIKEAKDLKAVRLIPPFKLYLVRKGDTLYSISQKFYKSSSAIADIMDWNRGWIRYPSQIQAGTPLVLYPSLSTKKGNVKVFNFIQHLDELREEEIALKDKNE